MKLLIASDIHGSKQLWEQLLEQAQSKDLKAVIICGDLTKVGTRYFLADAELAEIYMQRLGKLLPVYYIFGNHDINLNPYKFKNVHQLVNFPITVEGLSMAGINLSPCFDMPHLKQAWRDMTDDQIGRAHV